VVPKQDKVVQGLVQRQKRAPVAKESQERGVKKVGQEKRLSYQKTIAKEKDLQARAQSRPRGSGKETVTTGEAGKHLEKKIKGIRGSMNQNVPTEGSQVRGG